MAHNSSGAGHRLYHHGQGDHSHTHGAVDPTIATSERGMWAVKWSFAALFVTALLQLVVVALSGSVALLSDTIHNFGDALTAVLIILFSDIVAASQAVERIIHPQPVGVLWAVAVAALVSFTGNEAVAIFRIRVGRQ